jgi:hypothetical protein
MAEYISPVSPEQGGQIPVAEIHTRLLRDEVIRSLLGTQDKFVKALEEIMEEWVKSHHPEDFEGEGGYHDRAIDLVYSGILNKPTNIARSELLVNNEARNALEAKMESVRTWLWDHGRPPQGEEKESAEESSRVAIGGGIWLQVDEIGEQHYSEVAIYPAKFFVGKDDATTNIRAWFGYDDIYQLQIDYYCNADQPERRSAFYNSAIRPLEEMAENEAVIIGGLLDDIIASHEIEMSSGSTESTSEHS